MSGDDGEDNRDVTLERLMTDRERIRRLARSLVADESLVEDAVQHALLAAYRAPPRSVRRLRSWLYSVLANFSRGRRRAERRRRAREMRAARPEGGVPDAEEAVLLDELKEAVGRSVLALGDPYRSTVLRHYYHERSVAEIAREDGLPENTVRVRLNRAIRALREDLDRRYGGRRSVWCIPLWIYAGMAMPGAADGAPHGADGGRVSHRESPKPGAGAPPFALRRAIAVALVLAAASLLLHPLVQEDRGAAGSAAPEGRASLAGPMPARTSSVPTAPSLAIARGAPEALPPSRSEPSAELALLRVVDGASGEPVAGAEVLLRTPSWRSEDLARGRSPLDVLFRPFATESLGATGSDGRLALPRARLRSDRLLVVARGYAEYREDARDRSLGRGSGEYRVQLARPTTTVLRVLLPDGQPGAGIPVVIDGTRGDSLPATTDLEGEVEFQWTDAEHAIAIAAPPFAAIRVVAEAPVTEIRLAKGGTRHGRVLDASGSPVSGATIAIQTNAWGGSGLSCTTRADGRFETQSLPCDGTATLRVTHPDFPPLAAARPLAEAETWDLTLAAGIVVCGVVYGPDGRTVAEGEAILLPADEGFRVRELATAELDARGSFEVGPAPTGRYLLAIEHPRFAERVLPVPADAGRALTVHLDEGVPIRGRITDPYGSPVEGVRLRIGSIYGDELRGAALESGPDGTFLAEGLAEAAEHRTTFGSHRFSPVADASNHASFLLEVYRPHELLSSNGVEVPRLGLLGSRNTCAVPPGETVELVVETLASLPQGPCFELVDDDGRSVRTPTNLVVLPASDPRGGQVTIFGGTTGNPAKLHDPRALADSLVVFVTGSYAVAFDWIGERPTWPRRVVLEPLRAEPTTIRLSDSEGVPLRRRAVFVAPHLAGAEPFCALYLGHTTERGEVEVSTLPPGSFRACIARASEKNESLRGQRPYAGCLPASECHWLGTIHLGPTGRAHFEFTAPGFERSEDESLPLSEK